MGLDEALGTQEFEWHASDDPDIWCTYSMPKGVISPIVAAALGPDNATNVLMQAEFRSLLAITTWSGKTVVSPRGGKGFEAAVARFGTDVGAEARYQDFVGTAMGKLWPADRNEADLPKS
jgi:hypothetical protein